MAGLDTFLGDDFNMVSLTTAINKVPFKPSFLGSLGLFDDKPIATTVAKVEERHGTLSLVNSVSRRTRGTTNTTPARKTRVFDIPHMPQADAIWAEDVQNIRAFGTDDVLESVNEVVTQKMEQMRQNHEVTEEYHRIGALKGILLDGDGTTIFNYFTEFGISEKVIDFDFANNTAANQSIYNDVVEAQRHIQDSLGGTPVSGYGCIAGDAWYDEFVTSPEVRDAYGKFRINQGTNIEALSKFDSAGRQGNINTFSMYNTFFHNYRGSVGSTDFIESDEAHFFPLNTTNVFERYIAPGTYMETVNTMGKVLYMKREMMNFDKGVDLESQSNILNICTRPAVLVRGTVT